jgi:Protein of unknown function (DUF1552)
MKSGGAMKSGGTMKRRIFLQGIGGAALAAPFLGSLSRPARAAGDDPKRLVMFYTSNGVLLKNMHTVPADGAIDAATFKTLKGLGPDVAKKMLFPRGLAMFPRGQVTYEGTSYFDPHDQGMGSKLTCAPISSVETTHWAQGRSLDHIAAELVQQGDKTPFVACPSSYFANAKGTISYSVAGDGKAYTPDSNVTQIYSRLTGLFVEGGNAAAPATEGDYRVLRGNSILDLARDDLKAFESLNMSASDKRKVQAWMDLLRTTETKIIPGACNQDAATLLGIDDTTLKAAGGSSGTGMGGFGGAATEVKMKLGGDMIMNLMALNMLCDAKRVLLLQWPNFVTFTWDGMTHTADHHGISHRTGSAEVEGADPALYEPMIEQIDTWYGDKFARMVNLFNSIDEGDVKLLDNTATVWVPELGDGMAHNNDDLPFVVAGSMGGFLKTGVSIQTLPASTGGGGGGGFPGGGGNPFGSGGTPINQFYTSLLQGLGADVNEFGMCDTNKPEDGITKSGPLSIIHAAV